MTQYLWAIFSLGAALCWGLGYVLSEKLLKLGLTPAFMMFVGTLAGLPLYFFLAYHFGGLKSGFSLIFSNYKALWMLLFVEIIVVGANFLILHGILAKNATLASLIEISYPLFTLFFAWLLFQDAQLSWATAMGAVLIFSGVGVIVLNS